MLNNLKVSYKLCLGFGLLIVLLLGISLYSIQQMKALSSLTAKMYKHPFAVSVSVRDINFQIVAMHRTMKDVALAKNEDEINKAAKIVDKYEKDTLEYFKILEERFLGDKSRIKDAKQVFIDWKPIRDEVIDLMKNGEQLKASHITKNKGAKHIALINSKIKYIMDFANVKGKAFYDNAKNVKDDSLITVIIFLAITTVLAMIIGYMVTKNIVGSLSRFQYGLEGFFKYINKESSEVTTLEVTSSDEVGNMSTIVNKNILSAKKIIDEDNLLIENVKNVVEDAKNGILDKRIEVSTSNESLEELKSMFNEMMESMSQNICNDINKIEAALQSYQNLDFTYEIEDSKGKTSQGLNTLSRSICEMLVENKSNGLTLKNSSDVLLENVKKLNKNSTETATSLEETSASLEEITSTIRTNTDNVGKMASYANELSNSATGGEKLAAQTTEAMDEINEQVTLINEAISVIDQISFQTNILSLNAAVEAATAGESGKGFAVVAQEVRNLAARSAEAAKEIKELVESASIKANEGKDIADSMIHGYGTLNENISKTIDLISCVDTASKEQLSGIEQINDAVIHLDGQTQQNVSVATTVQEIAEQTNKISSVIVDSADAKEFIGKDI